MRKPRVLGLVVMLLGGTLAGAAAAVKWGWPAWQRHRVRQTLATAAAFYDSQPLYLRPFPAINEKNLAHHRLAGRYVGGRVFFEQGRTLPVSVASPARY